VIFCASNRAIFSKYCQEELYFARVSSIPVLPLALEPDLFEKLPGGLRMILQRIQWMDFSKVATSLGAGEGQAEDESSRSLYSQVIATLKKVSRLQVK
jgi:hypothetical protein